MRIARIRDSKVKETYGIISDDGKSVVMKADIQQQTGIPVPPNIKDFMFGGWLDEVKQQKNKLKYIHTRSAKLNFLFQFQTHPR